MIIAVTGHRPTKFGGYDENLPMIRAVKSHMRFILGNKYKRPTLQAISGMALGVDQWWAEACIELDIPFIAAVPFEGAELKWPKTSQERFRRILGAAAAIEYVSTPGYKPFKMQLRNEWMVNHANLLVAYWDGSEGGTGNCVRYAQGQKRIIEIYDPKTLTGELNGI